MGLDPSSEHNAGWPGLAAVPALQRALRIPSDFPQARRPARPADSSRRGCSVTAGALNTASAQIRAAARDLDQSIAQLTDAQAIIGLSGWLATGTFTTSLTAFNHDLIQAGRQLRDQCLTIAATLTCIADRYETAEAENLALHTGPGDEPWKDLTE